MAEPRVVLETSKGVIELECNMGGAPKTVAHMLALINDNLYDGTCFYRSDFVIQMGLQSFETGQAVANPHPDISVNETAACGFSNVRGTCAVAHWQSPDNGNSDFFINLKENKHLDEAYGGYCVWARVASEASFAVIDQIAVAVAEGEKVCVKTVRSS